MATLNDFIVFDKLKVHNLIVEPKRVRASYTVITGDKEESIDLIYSYDNPFFNRDSADDLNLASMMVAQVAMNYGLFCREIEFDGVYDRVDRRFLKEFIENTSREIITNKLLIDNEFIKPEYENPIFEKQERYTYAKLIFKNSDYTKLKQQEENHVSVDYSHFAILSSGGKDSLLTYGMVNEFGTAHPVFINESGRHWFTAVNAYRRFSLNEPNTVKPWCNSDRVFNWVLRRMPFIRKNYTQIRADIYPIRLWTVAVFLFGALPVVIKKNIGNVLIGNEYDTTKTDITHGIKHYNGLYDQSKYFDNAMTKYYSDKKWHINQYSILRTLSEMLIIKVLLKRYPELQKEQISCHAAIEKAKRMYPCGKCEKCRRIIGMLTALDETPERCGYSTTQIRHGLCQLEQKSVKQIGSDAAHLYYLLTEKGAIQKNNFTKKIAREHNEIMMLRIHKQRSNLEDLPRYIIEPLFKILEQYSEGAVIFDDGKWQPVDINKIIATRLASK